MIPGGEEFSFNVSRYTQETLERTAHNYELVPSGHTVLCIASGSIIRMPNLGSLGNTGFFFTARLTSTLPSAHTRHTAWI